MTTIAEQLKLLPAAPGVYLFKNNEGSVLYVGKAKSLRSRVRSYFRPSANLDPFKQTMVSHIASLETITCDTEVEALVLEANLIREHQPPYNVILRDDKFYLFIKITTPEEYPRVFPVRRIKKDGARYFGPYSSAASVRATLKLLRRIFPHRGEKESPREKVFPHPLFSPLGGWDSAARSIHGPSGQGSLPEGRESEAETKGRRHAGTAIPAPSAGSQPPPDVYQQNIQNIIRFLRGHRHEITETLQDGMKAASRAKQFERAAIFRDQFTAIERLEGSQKVYLPRRESFDAISIAHLSANNISAANVFQVRGGRLLGKNTFLLRHRGATPAADVLRQFLLQYYSVAQDVPARILIPLPLSDTDSLSHWINGEKPPQLTVPRRGHKRQLILMGQRNAEQLLTEETAAFAADHNARAATTELAEALHLQTKDSKRYLERIETYDISNIQGTLATGSMVVFTDGKPDRKHYKKFRIRGAAGPNDVAMIRQVLERRFSGEHHDWPTPDLVLIDGGKTQLAAAKKVLTEKSMGVGLASLAKREETLFTYRESKATAVQLPYDSAALFLVQRMRDEAHRFTLTYHRLLRQKQQRRSLLDEVPGIGPKTKKRLLNHFGSLSAIREASDTDLARIIGESKAKILRDYL